MTTALFLNGVHTVLLDAIEKTQKHLPELVLYLQPYSTYRIRPFADYPHTQWPTYYIFSTTDDSSTIQFISEVYGWENKEDLWANNKERWGAISKVIQTFMNDENPEGLYRFGTSEDKICKNLLLLQNVRKLENPISITEFKKVKDGTPLQEGMRGWSHVQLTAEQLDMLKNLTRN